MARRGRKASMTNAELLEKVVEEITQTEQHLKELKAQKKDLEQAIENEEIVEIKQLMKQSGKSINVKGAISKRGNKYARYILFNCSQMVVKLGASNYPEHPVYIYYQNKKAEGKHYYESLTACSTKILRMLYSMCKNNKQFLEN